MEKQRIKNANGITLIALVITIIILLILAGITLNLTIGEHGIINKAQEAGKLYQNATKDEQEQLGWFLNEVDNIINGTGGNSKPTPPFAPNPPTASVGGTTHTEKQIQYTWEELNSIAKVISDNYGTEVGKINNDTAEVAVSINGKSDTLGIGDYTIVEVNGVDYKVRILGFNHDELTNENAYGGTNTYAGISFEFSECITTEQMNNTETNVGGWGACALRGTLNSTIYNSFENKQYIKEVSKRYIATFDNASSVTNSSDKLWLLSCSEIWNNGDKSGYYGYAITSEGEQYKYYKNINANYKTANTNLVKSSGSSIDWWLRSPLYGTSAGFCSVSLNGYCRGNANNTNGISAGFSI